jgi:hypothetical protein
VGGVVFWAGISGEMPNHLRKNKKAEVEKIRVLQSRMAENLRWDFTDSHLIEGGRLEKNVTGANNPDLTE